MDGFGLRKEIEGIKTSVDNTVNLVNTMKAQNDQVKSSVMNYDESIMTMSNRLNKFDEELTAIDTNKNLIKLGVIIALVWILILTVYVVIR